MAKSSSIYTGLRTTSCPPIRDAEVCINGMPDVTNSKNGMELHNSTLDEYGLCMCAKCAPDADGENVMRRLKEFEENAASRRNEIEREMDENFKRVFTGEESKPPVSKPPKPFMQTLTKKEIRNARKKELRKQRRNEMKHNQFVKK